ncbi:MAG: glycoside hydrolase family 71/99 protein [Pirellulaceae bacterium]
MSHCTSTLPRLIVGLLVSSGVLASASEPAQKVLVGVNYFAGWWEPTPNKWQGPDKVDWRPQYPDRVPLLGEYNEQATMDREIAAAADYGVDYFQILWYASDPGVDWGPNTERVNVAVAQFMNSPQAHRMKFVIEFCNHRPFGISNAQRWTECVNFWVKCMQHPSYLQVGGRRVFKIHGSGAFIEQCGGDAAQVKRVLEELRAAARAAGLGVLLIGCGAVGPSRIPPGHWIAPLFDFTNEYMDIPQLPNQKAEYPYEKLAEWHAQWRPGHTEDAIPSVPFIGSGWNPRPWGDPRPAFQFPNRQQWKAALEKVKTDLASGKFGFPLPDKTLQPAVTIYCWNEFGEGGMVAPTRGDKYMKLEVIREVFGPAAPERR